MSSSSVSLPGARRIWLAGGLALLCAVALNFIARAVDLAALPISPAFTPLGPIPVVFWTVVGVAGATLVRLFLSQSPKGSRTFLIVAVIVLVLSFIPDVMLLAIPMVPGTNVSAVGALMSMHVIAGLVCMIFLTLPPKSPTRT